MTTKTICWMIRDETGETYIDENCLWLHEADAVEAAGLMDDPDHTYTAFAVAAVEPAQPVEAVDDYTAEGFAEWINSAYSFKGDGSFTRFNMEVAYAAGMERAALAQPSQHVEAVKCECTGNFGPNPDCGQCGGDGTYEALAHPRPTGAGCPCEPNGSDGMRCPSADGKLLCDPASSAPTGEQAGEVHEKAIRATALECASRAYGYFRGDSAGGGDAIQYFERNLGLPGNAYTVDMHAGILRKHFPAHPRPVGIPAGEVVAYRLVSKHKAALSGAWQDGDVPDDLNESGVSKTHTIQRAYAQTRPVGVPDGEESHD